MKPPTKRMTGVLKEVLNETIARIEYSTNEPLAYEHGSRKQITVNVRNTEAIANLRHWIGQLVEVTVSTLPLHRNDIVFGTLQLVNLGNCFYTGFEPEAAQTDPKAALMAFAKVWSSLDQPPTIYQGTTQVSFLFPEQRYTEQTLVELNFTAEKGSISLPQSSILNRFRLQNTFDTSSHTMSLRNGGSLCIIGHDQGIQDYVFWVNPQITKRWIKAQHTSPS